MISFDYSIFCDGQDCIEGYRGDIKSDPPEERIKFLEKKGWMFVKNGQCYCPKHTKSIVRRLKATVKKGGSKTP